MLLCDSKIPVVTNKTYQRMVNQWFGLIVQFIMGIAVRIGLRLYFQTIIKFSAN